MKAASVGILGRMVAGLGWWSFREGRGGSLSYTAAGREEIAKGDRNA
jgi:hypothetical protein